MNKIRDIEWYLDEAKQIQGHSSDRQLCLSLGRKSSYTTHLRKKAMLPSPDSMIEISKLAGIDPAIALMDLAIWNSDGEAKKTYSTILQKITQTTAIAALFLASVAPYGASAATKQEHQNYDKSRIIHYHTLLQWLISLYYSSLKNVRAFSVLHQRVTSKRLRSFGVFTYNHPLINT